MKKIIFLMTVMFSFLFVSQTAQATFEDGKHTIDKSLIFSLAVKAGDVIEVDYYSASEYSTGQLSINKLDGEVLYKTSWPSNKGNKTVIYTFTNDYNGFVVVTMGDKSIRNAIYEVRVNGEMAFDGHDFVSNYIAIDNRFVSVEEGVNKAKLVFNKSYIPSGYTVKEILLYRSENSYAKTDSNLSHEFTNLVASTDYKYKLKIAFDNGKSSKDIEVSFRTLDLHAEGVAEVKKITANSAEIHLDYSKVNAITKAVNLYDAQGKIAGRVENGIAIIPIKNLQPETTYEYYVEVVIDDLNKSGKQKIAFTTTAANKEVSSLTATATAKEVNLMWKMPEYKDLEIARIYRQKADVGMFARMFKTASTFEPLFETNGTTFKDLTVHADTEYTYKVTTVDASDNESEGKTVKVRTKKMSVSGGGTNKDENGDYVITWTSPTTGKIKVLVGGVEYAIVPASDKKIIIPKDKMKFDIIGNPDVKLIPIDENGNEGIPSKPGAGEGTGNGGGIGDIVGGGDLAEVLNPENTISGGVQLLGVVGLFLLLGLAFRVVPKLVRMIRNAFSNKDENTYGVRRVRE